MSIMEIKNPNGHSAKKRKFSHGSEKSDPSEDDTSESTTDTEDQSKRNDDRMAVQRNSKPIERQRPTSKAIGAVAATTPVNASTIALQLDDMLKETQSNYDSYISTVRPIFERIQSIIRTIPDRPSMSFAEAETALRKQEVTVPFPSPRPAKDAQYQFEYKAPEITFLRGAVFNKLGIRGNRLVEIAVQMPKSIIQEKDYLNYRILYKGSLYLACIAAKIKKSDLSEFELEYGFLDDVRLLPTIKLTPRSKDSKQQEPYGYQYQIDVIFPHEVIPVEKTLPGRNCIRSGALASSETHPRSVSFYNSCLRSQASRRSQDDLIRIARDKCAAFADVCRAGQHWLRRRGFSSSISEGGFGYCEWALMCALLLDSGGPRGHPLFSSRYNTVQLFKAMLQILASKDFSEPMIIYSTKLKLQTSGIPTLFDANSGVNILFKMSSWSYQALRHQAQLSLTALNARNQNNFDHVFVTRIAEPLLQFDEIYSIIFPSSEGESSLERIERFELMYTTLKRGLQDRAILLDLSVPGHSRWDVAKSTETIQKDSDIITLRLILNPETVTRLVDHGPSAEDENEVTDFRKFWGEKSELRRFKDGSIKESIIWSAEPSVSLQIVQHLLGLHFQLSTTSISPRNQNLESRILSPNSTLNAVDAFRLVNKTYQSLSSTLHQMDGLPLPIRSISPASVNLRYSNLLHPLSPPTAKPTDILIQFDSSARWPDSLTAIQHTKIAFLLKVADLLSSSDDNLTTRLGLENASNTADGYSSTSFLDIIYPSPGPGLSGICFRARIHHERELHLLQTALTDKTLHGSTRESLASALTLYKRNNLATSVHTTTIQSLCTRFNMLSSTIRLLKNWVASHLLLRQVPEEILEIIAANTFLQPAPWSPPGSATTAFLRCLYFLSTWDWTYSPLIVDLSVSQEITEQAISDIQTRFQAWRKLDPNMNNVVWFVGTNIDPTGVVWTQGTRPPRVIATRVKALAQASIELIKTKGTSMEIQDWENIFISPITTSHFDFILHLDNSVITSKSTNNSRKSVQNGVDPTQFKNLQIQEQLDIGKIGYDPVEFLLQDLEHAFGNVAIFFYDSNGGNVIAGLVKPNVKGTKEWRVRQGFSSIPLAEGESSSENSKCELNLQGILAEIAILGEGLVKKITSKG